LEGEVASPVHNEPCSENRTDTYNPAVGLAGPSLRAVDSWELAGQISGKQIVNTTINIH